MTRPRSESGGRVFFAESQPKKCQWDYCYPISPTKSSIPCRYYNQVDNFSFCVFPQPEKVFYIIGFNRWRQLHLYTNYFPILGF